MPSLRAKMGRVAIEAMAFALMLPALSGCGWIADESRIVIAMVDGNPIRRGDLMRSIREMSEEERPLIQTKFDLIQALRDYIDRRIQTPLAERLANQGVINVPREVAREAYFALHPEHRNVFEIPDPSVIGLSEQDLAGMRAAIEFGTDDILAELLRRQAVAYQAQQWADAGEIRVGEEEFEREYEIRRGELIKPELIEFVAVRIPADEPGAVARAADVRRRVDAGESFESIISEFESTNPDSVFRSAFENDPSREKFRTFWAGASGAAEGDIVGPLYLPEYDLVTSAPGGPQEIGTQPAAHLVLKVLTHEPAEEMTLEEAKPVLQSQILIRQAAARLRTEHGVEIFEENLPDPSGFGDQFKKFMIKTTPGGG